MKRTDVVLLMLSVVVSACTAAGPIVSNPLPKIAEPDKAAEVVVIRENSFYGGAKTYRILLDDREIFGINSGEYTRFKVSYGKHSIGVKCNVSFGIPMSDKIDIDLEPKTTSYYFLSKKFQCANIEPKLAQEGEVLVGKSTYRTFE
jgi:hypothetical protein